MEEEQPNISPEDAEEIKKQMLKEDSKDMLSKLFYHYEALLRSKDINMEQIEEYNKLITLILDKLEKQYILLHKKSKYEIDKEIKGIVMIIQGFINQLTAMLTYIRNNKDATSDIMRLYLTEDIKSYNLMYILIKHYMEKLETMVEKRICSECNFNVATHMCNLCKVDFCSTQCFEKEHIKICF